MAFFLFLAFLAVPIVEIVVIIKVGGVIGAWQTVGLIILTAATGALMVRAQGFQVLARAQQSLARGQFPAEEMFDGLSLLVAGVLLLTPGFVTDALGLLLLIPPLRRALARAAWAWLLAPGHAHVHARWTRRDGDGVIEGEYSRLHDPRIGDDRRDR